MKKLPFWAQVPEQKLKELGATVVDKTRVEREAFAFSITWVDKATLIRCEVFVALSEGAPREHGRREGYSFVNGYVWPPEGCPSFGDGDIEVPGGVTYPSDGVWDGVGKAGFDTQHYGTPREEYPAVRVIEETINMARQVADLCPPAVRLAALYKAEEE